MPINDMATSLASRAQNIYGFSLQPIFPFSTKGGKDPIWQLFLLRFARLQYGGPDRRLPTVTKEFDWVRFVPGDTDGFIPLTQVPKHLL